MPPLIEMKTKGKKGIIAYNKSYGTSFMKYHVEVLNLKLLLTYVIKHFAHDRITGSQERSDEGGRLMQPTKKCTKVAVRTISSFLVIKPLTKGTMKLKTYF